MSETRIIRTENLVYCWQKVYSRVSGQYLGFIFNMPKLPMPLMIEWDRIAEQVFADTMRPKRKGRKPK